MCKYKGPPHLYDLRRTRLLQSFFSPSICLQPTVCMDGDSAPLGASLQLNEGVCPSDSVSQMAHHLAERVSSGKGGGATTSGGLLFSLADELQSLLLAKLQAKELISLAKTCKRAREIIMEGVISDAVWEQLLVNDFPCVAGDLAALTDAPDPCTSLREVEDVETFSTFISTRNAPTLDPLDPHASPSRGPSTPSLSSKSPAWFKQYRTAASTIGNFLSVSWRLPSVRRESVSGRRQGAGSTVMNGKLYVFGGWMSNNSISSDVVCLSQAPDKELVWSRLAVQGDGPQPVYGCTITAASSQHHGDCLVTHGGVIWGGYQGAVNDIRILTSTAPGEEPGIWVCPDEAHEFGPPIPRAYHTAAFVPASRSRPGTEGLYVFGGFSNGRARAHLEVLNVDGEVARWSRPVCSGREPSPRFGHSCTYMSDILVFAGGSNGGHNHKGRGTVGQELEDVHVLHFDEEVPRWAELRLTTPVPKRCMQRCHSAVAMGKRILLFAGGPSYDLSSNIDVLDPFKATIKRPKVSGFEPRPRQGAAVGVPWGPGKMIVWGGWNGSELGDLNMLTLDAWNAGDSQALQDNVALASSTPLWISPLSVQGVWAMLRNSSSQSRMQSAIVVLFIISVGSFATSPSWMT